jgi:hypothetical protein
MDHRSSSFSAGSSSGSTRGCGSCGGGSYHPPAVAPSSCDPCAGGLTSSASRREASCGCGRGGGCSCGSTAMVRAAPAWATRTYDREQCPTFAISCETKQALRDCAKVAFCDLLRCVSETLCPDGQFDVERFSTKPPPVIVPGGSAATTPQRTLQAELLNCVGQALCTFMHCVPQALCPEPCDRAPVDCLPCGYAVEVLR